ncbi:hypothetical protein PAP_09245 [Palaeococcus pacificus DY20341]|uniref:Serine/threonine protein kinase n=1 Tax=Palaeococcus pacificus DY20341 TaxID=1343739 RepID=A0A075LW30_9EURY|nr:serine/threonine protein kinase [Palaeococcus pacificus]AIF70227.1 hypothetical protein PAP_09245 [Palaeococcus pacificus DY20341]
MISHLLDEDTLKRFYGHLGERGITDVIPYSKGNTSLVFTGQLKGEKVLIKLQRRDSPRKTLKREAEILEFLKGQGITSELIFAGSFEGLDYLVRCFMDGEPILYADVEKRHIIEIAQKTLKLDQLGVDHGQIQGGKHILIGKDVWIIDFEKASLRRKPKNLTSAMAMVFLNDNTISKKIREKFGIEEEFLDALKDAVGVYKKSGNSAKVLELLSTL